MLMRKKYHVFSLMKVFLSVVLDSSVNIDNIGGGVLNKHSFITSHHSQTLICTWNWLHEFLKI